MKDVRSDLGHVNRGTNYDIHIDPRIKHRAFTALTLDGNVPLRALRGILKRGAVVSARICTRLVGPGVNRSASEVHRGVNKVFHLTGWRRKVLVQQIQ